MPTRVHTVTEGDTFELISTIYFGEPSQAGRIRSSNPGVAGTLSPGTKILVTGVDDTPDTVAESDGLTARIDGILFRHWTSVSLKLSIDKLATAQIVCPLVDTPEFREVIEPFKFQSMDISDGGERLFRGTMVQTLPEVSSQGSTVTLGGYSLPGAINDCMAPASAYPIQFRKLNILDIARKLCEPFGINVVMEGDPGAVFRKVKLKRDKTIMQFLNGLAAKRQLLIRSNANGELVIAEPPTVAAPVATLREGLPPVEGVKSQFRAQSYFSHTTCVRRTSRGKFGGQNTVRNERAIEAGIMRPLTKSLREVTRSELPEASAAAAGRMLANSVGYSVKVADWRDPMGNYWRPGDTVELEAPRVFVPEPYLFQIRSAELKRTPGGTSAVLNLMLPGAFGGEPPTMLPWQ